MSTFGNLIWLLLGGVIVALIYFFGGILFCITIVGIPFGTQLFKLGAFSLHPFGKEVVTKGGDMGCLSIAMNIVWILIGAWEIALIHIAFGAILCVTIVGIPLGKQHFKMAKLALFPFGRDFVAKP